MTRCPHFFEASQCSLCRRLRLLGQLVGPAWVYSPTFGTALDALDAIADLLIDGAVRRRDARRELNDAIDGGQREASDAFREGLDEGSRNEWDGWG